MLNVDERVPNTVVFHIDGPGPLEQPVRVCRITEFATDRLEDKERKRRFLRGVPVEEIQEDRLESIYV